MENKDIAKELQQLRSLGLSKEAYEFVALSCEQCYLRGKLRVQTESRDQLRKIIRDMKGGS